MTTPAATAPFRLDGKTAVVTGAAAGIGRAIAQTFAAHGAAVHILDINAAAAESLAKEIDSGKGGRGGAAHVHACDVSDPISVDKHSATSSAPAVSTSSSIMPASPTSVTSRTRPTPTSTKSSASTSKAFTTARKPSWVT